MDHRINTAFGRPVTGSLEMYRGKPGSGTSVEFRIKEGPTPPTENTNARGFFQPDVRTLLNAWLAEGPTHHFALGLGRRTRTLTKVGQVLGNKTMIVNPPRDRDVDCDSGA